MNNDTYIRILLEHQMTKNYIKQQTKNIINDKINTLQNNYNIEITNIKNDIEKKFNSEMPKKIIETVPILLNDSRKMNEILLQQTDCE